MGNSFLFAPIPKPAVGGREVHRMPCRCAQGRPCPKPPIPREHQQIQGVPRYQSRNSVYEKPFAHRVRSGRHKEETLDRQTFSAAHVVKGADHGFLDENAIYPSKPGIGMQSKPYYRRTYHNIH